MLLALLLLLLLLLMSNTLFSRVILQCFLLCRPRFKFGQQLKQLKDGILERTRSKRNKNDAIPHGLTKDPAMLDSLEIGKSITITEEESPGHESCESAGSDSLYDLSLETFRQHVIPNPHKDTIEEELDPEPDFEKVPDSLGEESLMSQSDSNASSLVFNRLIVDTDDSNDEVDAESNPVSPTITLNNYESSLKAKSFPTSNKPVPSQRSCLPKVDDLHQTENPMTSSSSSPCLSDHTKKPKRKPITLPRNKSLRIKATTYSSDSIDSPVLSRDISRKNRPQTVPRKWYRHVSENGALSSSKPEEKPVIIPRKSSGTLQDLEDAEPPVPKPRIKKQRKSFKSSVEDSERFDDLVDTITSLPNTNESGTLTPGSSLLIERKAHSIGTIRKHQLLRPMSSCSVDTRLPPNSSIFHKSVSSEELNDKDKSDLTLAIAPAIEMAPFEDDGDLRDHFIEKNRRSKTTSRIMRNRSQLIEVKGTLLFIKHISSSLLVVFFLQ